MSTDNNTESTETPESLENRCIGCRTGNMRLCRSFPAAPPQKDTPKSKSIPGITWRRPGWA